MIQAFHCFSLDELKPSRRYLDSESFYMNKRRLSSGREMSCPSLNRDLHVGNNIRVPALNVARIHGGRGVAVHTSVRDEGVRVQRAGIKQAVDLPEASTRTGRAGIRSSIDVVAENVLRCTRGPRK